MCGLSETHWKGNGHFLTESHAVYFSGNDSTSTNGVAFLLPEQLRNCVIGYESGSDRVLSIKLKASPVNLNILQVYAPTSTASDANLESLYSELESTISKVPNREILLIIGDFNAKIGASSHQLSPNVGKFGLGQRNERGERLTSSSIHGHWTWTSPDGNYRNQIDYILIGSRWKTSIRNSHTLPGTD